jgi:predicted O-methyltransferase YrrM
MSADLSHFDDALAAIEGVEGWLTEGQARLLFETARAVPADGTIVEIGSFRGRSTIVLARGADPSVEVVAIDPHAGNDRGPQEIGGFAAEAEDDHRVFLANLDRAGVRERVRVLRAFSGDAHGDVEGPVDLLWVDGAHRAKPAHEDLKRWGDRVRPGGRMLVHDSWCSVGVTLATLAAVTASGAWRYDGREGSLAAYTRVPASRANRWEQLKELPWFAANVARKVKIVATRSGDPWPY